MTTKRKTTKNGASVKEAAATESTVETATAEPTQSAPELTIQDLQNLRSIVDVASQRGAFKATELTQVGVTYDRLNTFLIAVTEKNEAETVEE